MISKEAYTLSRVKAYVTLKQTEEKVIVPAVLQELNEQWEFDYRVEKEYRPEVLKIKGV